MNTQKTAIFSLYRSFRRQINLLPSEYLRQFYRVKLSDDVRRALNSKRDDLLQTKLKRLQRNLRDIQAANNEKSFKRYSKILERAYGQRGPLKWEILEPLLSDPKAPLPPRIIPAVEKSRPPVFSPRLAALLMSPYSRSKPLKRSHLQTPPTLPARADPKSEEARLLGPFSKRREVNIRWRYFTDQARRASMPLQVVVYDKATGKKETSREALARAGIEPLGFQDTGLYEEARALAGPKQRRPPLPRRESRPSEPEETTTKSELPRRFLRRRYQQLVSKIPVLTYTYNSEDAKKPGNYSVSINAFPSQGSQQPVMADETLLQWMPKTETPAKRK